MAKIKTGGGPDADGGGVDQDDESHGRVLIPGKPEMERCDNQVVSAKYTAWNFFPKAILAQFRRLANLYFLVIGCISSVGWYTSAFDSAISPLTILGPLSIVISISLLVEGSGDMKRHRNDEETNQACCVVLSRAETLGPDDERDDRVMKGKDVRVNLNKAFYADQSGVVPGFIRTNSNNSTLSAATTGAEKNDNPNEVKVAFQKVPRMDIRQGQFVLIKNRDMVPADIIILASSNDHGGAYIETSSIDGETNLKLRTSPRLPSSVLQHLREGNPLDIIEESEDEDLQALPQSDELHDFETIAQATKRITRFSALGRPNGESALDHPNYISAVEEQEEVLDEGDRGKQRQRLSAKAIKKKVRGSVHNIKEGLQNSRAENRLTVPNDGRFVSALTTEHPNPSVHTFDGKLTFPPFEIDGAPVDVPLGAENILLRGAVLRNTEWAIGLACFTGRDTKLIQNSFKTPSKFSALDKLMNKCVLTILGVMIACISCLSISAWVTNDRKFQDLWYAGMNKDVNEPWPYLQGLEPPKWETSPPNFFQFFFLYVTLLSNLIPLSLYVTVEFCTFAMLWFLYSDKDMYDDTTNTRATARSTTITDLGRVQYIFSDKTGTLTQNVMRFKRCSVDGLAFGAPIQAATKDDESSFLPLRQLLVGRLKSPNQSGLEGIGVHSTEDPTEIASQRLTFNAEMFLRVLCLCHTVVVEKDLDKKDHISSGMSAMSTGSGTRSLGAMARNLFGGRKGTNTGDSSVLADMEQIIELESRRSTGNRSRSASVNSLPEGQTEEDMINEKSVDGAPYGYAFQAESPDEGALVSAASSTYGFQVVGRDSSGIQLRVAAPSILENQEVTDNIRSGALPLKRLAAESASMFDRANGDNAGVLQTEVTEYFDRETRDETWSILAVNKFDSDRKRMSILLRSPPELGSLPILFCKGADSAMLNPDIVSSPEMLTRVDSLRKPDSPLPKPDSIAGRGRDVSALTIGESVDVSEDELVDADNWDMATMLGIQAHLGDFAKEGLRTLVLGLRVLTEEECNIWLEEYKAAAVSLKNRSELLTAAAFKIERNLHIVGATAIEDKLQKNVPSTINTLARAGIKLWVLTGDKRETAVEIGYSALVITPEMNLTQVADNGEDHVRTQMCMEFIRMVKIGKLPEYQKSQLDENRPRNAKMRWRQALLNIRVYSRAFGRICSLVTVGVLKLLCLKNRANRRLERIVESKLADQNLVNETVRRGKVRAHAEATVRKWLASEAGKVEMAKRPAAEDNDEELSLASEETPAVFTRASSAKELLSSLKNAGPLVDTEIRELSLAQLTAQQSADEAEEQVVDEDTLSLNSFFPGNKEDLANNFDKKKRTILERLFAIDRQVRKGHLKKHVHWQKLATIEEQGPVCESNASASRDARLGRKTSSGTRALVIEGAALKHLLGNPETEEILFAVASQCEAVIACRVSPQQKALLVKLVRQNVMPEPTTLAIGDGANDVGMIHEAHVGIGISGKEGQQAVNASDFAISQFRFLETLVLIHGRWDFFRLSTVVLFSFYKNALMAGILILYTSRTLYSGTPLFDEWVMAMLNFVAAWPIITIGLFDRCLGKDYVRKHPEVYKPTRENELITIRTLLRWIVLLLVHVFTIYFYIVPQLSFGGGMTSAFRGLMRDNMDNGPGDGEGGDLKSVGLVTFTCMIILLAYKVILEARSLVHGRWPAFTCRQKDKGEGFLSRMAHTWVGITFLSILFYMLGISLYQLIGRGGASTFSQFVDTPNHVFGTRSMSWLLVIFVPLCALMLDMIAKVFSNLFYPTQTQIHMEIEAKQKRAARLQRIERTGSRRRLAVEPETA